LRAEADSLGAALWVGEYGGDVDHPGITPYMDAEYDAFAAVFAGSTYWDFSRGDGDGIANDDGSEKPVLWDVLVRPAPERIAGTPKSWSFDESTATFSLTYSAAGDAPTLVHVPARAYPTGFVVDVSGGEAVVTGRALAISAEEGADVVVVVSPAG
jgi:endoglycosylceramidase